jgi:hypothetical protein
LAYLSRIYCVDGCIIIIYINTQQNANNKNSIFIVFYCTHVFLESYFERTSCLAYVLIRTIHTTEFNYTTIILFIIIVLFSYDSDSFIYYFISVSLNMLVTSLISYPIYVNLANLSCFRVFSLSFWLKWRVVLSLFIFCFNEKEKEILIDNNNVYSFYCFVLTYLKLV